MFEPVRAELRNLLRQRCDGPSMKETRWPVGSGLTRGTLPLTHRSLEAVRLASVPYRVADQRCIGLAVRVAPSGIKTWDLAYRIRGSGKVRRVSLGRVVDLSLDKARDRANELTSAARAGRDLVAEESDSRSAAAARLTVEQLIALYVRRRVTGRLRTATDIERRLKRALAPLFARYAEEVRRRDFGNYWTLRLIKASSAKQRSVGKLSEPCFGGPCRKTS